MRREENSKLEKSGRQASTCSADTAATSSVSTTTSWRSTGEPLPIAAVDAETDIGPRAANEDRFSAVMDLNEEANATGPHQALFAVFDGHGGAQASDFCEKNFPAILAGQRCLTDDPRQALLDSFDAVEEKYVEQCPANAQRTGTTAAVALIRSKSLHCAWAGDSEAWLFKKGGVPVQIMDPHRPVRSDERRRVERAGGLVVREDIAMRVDFRQRKRIGRVNGVLAVSRALGDMRYKEWVISTPEYTETALDGQEDFLVIASDGLWDVMAPNAVSAIVKKYVAARRKSRVADPTTGLAAHLIGAVKAKANVDNITAVVVFFPRAVPELMRTEATQNSRKQARAGRSLRDEAERSPKRIIPKILAMLNP